MKRIVMSSIIVMFFLGFAMCNNSNPNTITPVNRTHPQIFMAWSDVENCDNEDLLTRIARHGLAWGRANSSSLSLKWISSESHPHEGLCTSFDPSSIPIADARRNTIRSLNPKTLMLASIN
jgi:hypothetical protein